MSGLPVSDLWMLNLDQYKGLRQSCVIRLTHVLGIFHHLSLVKETIFESLLEWTPKRRVYKIYIRRWVANIQHNYCVTEYVHFYFPVIKSRIW
jgi:hypothetical protein